MRKEDKLLERAYKKYCGGEDHCYFITCPVNALMMNLAIHRYQKNELLVYGDTKLLERLGK